ncbi:GGDEF domain-containing protein [Thiocystis violacea]|uniref:GGDEF domain-containing protein n=1 Tax=Thiocystis violacea TaxID=13725 RepID=UPI001907445F|nr:GGDEF domain-containing protein [Thiocystis violacea]MBK1718548.1 diguanylate cyclase [Thiocystis violacea]
MDGELGKQLIDSLRIGVILLDPNGRVIAWNAWMRRHSGLQLADVSGRLIAEVFPDTANSRLGIGIEQALRFKLSSMLAPGLNPGMLPLHQKPADRKLDRRMQQLVYVTPLNHAQCACLIQIHDMTATVRREQRLRAQSSQLIETAYRDALTGIGNRRRFDHDLAERFRQAQQRRSPVALLMIDVDEFKAYNDHLGHPKGDACLIKVATTLQETLRGQDDGMTRYGGEEFALLLADTTLDEACAVAERLRQGIQDLRIPHPNSHGPGHVTVSVGIAAMVPTADQLCYILLAQADLALYTAKDAGRNRCMCYDPDSGEANHCR